MSDTLYFFISTPAPTEIYTLSLHDALPIFAHGDGAGHIRRRGEARARREPDGEGRRRRRSEEHTSELQSRLHLVCRLLLEKKKKDDYVANRTYVINVVDIV